VPKLPGAEREQKRELVINSIAQRLKIQEKTVWARLDELRSFHRDLQATKRQHTVPEFQEVPVRTVEKQLFELLLAQPEFAPEVVPEIRDGDITNPDLCKLLEHLRAMESGGERIDIDQLRSRLEDRSLVDKACKLHQNGMLLLQKEISLQKELEGRMKQLTDEIKKAKTDGHKDIIDRKSHQLSLLRAQSETLTKERQGKVYLIVRDLLAEFRRIRREPEKQEIHNQLHAADDHTDGVEKLRRLQAQTVSVDPGAASLAGDARP